MAITGAVEGDSDEAVLRRLIDEVGCWQGTIYGKRGKEFLRPRIVGYNSAARFSPWVVLVDLDHSHHCAPELRAEWLPAPSAMMCFRVAHYAVEAWLLADTQRFSDFFRVARSRIPADVESLAQPKVTLVNLVRKSRLKNIREDMVPSPGSGREVGRAYTSRIIEYAQDAANGWRPSTAARHSNSLRRCLSCMRRISGAGVSA